MKLVINKCFGGFGLSNAAYERLIELGVPVRAYIEQKRENGLYLPEPLNDGEVIFDRRMGKGDLFDALTQLTGTYYWDTWLSDNRSHPLLVQVVEELGDKANGRCAKLGVVGIPDDTEYTIEEYDGNEHVAEKHRTWS